MPQRDIRQTFKSNQFRREEEVPNDLMTVEFRDEDPTDLTANPLRVWANKTDGKIKYTVDGVNVNEFADVAELEDKASLEDLEETNEAVALKANQADMEVALAAKRDTSVPIGVNDISSSLAAAIAGDTTVNVLSIPRVKSVTPATTTFIETGINLFNKNDPDIVLEYYLSQTGVHTVNASLFISGKIPVTPGEVYSIPFINLIGDTTCGCYYNADDEVVTYVTGVTTGSYRVITVPANDDILYMKVNLRILFIDTAMVVQGGTYPGTYYPYQISLSNDMGLNNTQISEVTAIAEVNGLNGKIATFNGDSICYGQGFLGGYGKIITDRNAMGYENVGVSGGTIAAETYQGGVTPRHWICRTIDEMRDDADFIILEGGINDSALGVTMGAITSDYISTLDDTTFCGAFESMLKQSYNRFPGKKIGFVITHRMNGNFQPYYNNIVLILNKWGVPYCDLYKEAPPLNYIDNLKTAYTLSADGWHPNEAGYRAYYCDKIEAWMRTL